MNLHKIIAAILSVALILSVCSCGNVDTPVSSVASPDTSSEVDIDTVSTGSVTDVSCSTSEAVSDVAISSDAPVSSSLISEASSEEINSLKDKTFIFLGSSVTLGSAANNKSFVDYIHERNDCTCIKLAVGGTTLVDNGGTSYVSRLKANANKYNKCDRFICQLSTNDAGAGFPIGDIGQSFDINDFDTSTISGAIQYIIAFAKDKWNCPVSFYTNTYYQNANYQAMVDCLLEIKEKWNITVLDLWNDESMRKVGASRYFSYMADNIHPNELGYKEWWTPKFEAFLIEQC